MRTNIAISSRSKPQQPKPEAVLEGKRRRRIEDIREAARLEREVLLDVWDLSDFDRSERK